MSGESAVPGTSERPAREKARAPRSEFEAFTQEDLALLYRRQTRTALVTLAAAAIAVVIAIVVIGIFLVMGISHENHLLNQLIRAVHELPVARRAGI
jgi:ABC-type sulfate transport system permease component